MSFCVLVYRHCMDTIWALGPIASLSCKTTALFPQSCIFFSSKSKVNFPFDTDVLCFITCSYLSQTDNIFFFELVRWYVTINNDQRSTLTSFVNILSSITSSIRISVSGRTCDVTSIKLLSSSPTVNLH